MTSRVHLLAFVPLVPLMAGMACNAPLRAIGLQRQATAAAVGSTIEAYSTQPLNSPTTPTPLSTASASTATPDFSPPGPFFDYVTQPGDTWEGLSGRFGIGSDLIPFSQSILRTGLLEPGITLRIANGLGEVSPGVALLPDHEVVYSPAAADFDVPSYVQTAGGFLASYREEIDDEVLSGPEIVQRVAEELSINPSLLLGLLEYRSGWVFGSPAGASDDPYPLDLRIPGRPGLYQELTVAGTQLNRGYYGWREGTQVEATFEDGSTLRFHPGLNPGSVALMHLLAILRPRERWMESLYGAGSFPTLYASWFGDPWARARAVGPLIPPDLVQPPLELPFATGERWSLTGGPHPGWNAGTPRGALDFSPITSEDPCAVSVRWVTASAAGTVVRAADNALALDLDGDGREATGWVVVYYHLADEGLIPEGAQVVLGTRLGHPSCEGGRATGKHVHIARKYNGEWLEADGPVPMVLSGWQVVADDRSYYGSLVKGGEVVRSDSSGRSGSTIVH